MLLLSQHSGFAQDDLYELVLDEYLDIKVSSASRSARSVKDLPFTIHVITREDIEKNNYTSLVEALKDVPTIRTSQPGNGVEGELFLMRGLQGNAYTKIMLNGMPLTPSVVSGMPLGEQINMASVESIEIIFGPSASLYGADALAGVINITTREIDEPIVSAEMTGGNLGYLNTNVFGGFKKNKWTFQLGAVFSKRNNQNIFRDYDEVYDAESYYERDEFGSATATDFNEFPHLSYGISLGAENGKFRFHYELMGRRDHSSLGQKPSAYVYNNDDLIWGETIQRLMVKFDQPLNRKKNINYSTNLSYLWYRLNTGSAFGLNFGTPEPDDVTFNYKYAASDDILWENLVIWNLSYNTEILGGASVQVFGNLPKTNDLADEFTPSHYRPFATEVDKAAESPLFKDFGLNPIVNSNIGGFIQLTNMTDKHTLMASARYDYHSRYGPVFNPRIAFKFDLTESTAFRTSYGTAFRAASPFFAYNAVAIPAGSQEDSITYLFIPNPQLKPERFSTYEIGIRQVLGAKLSLEFVYSQNTINDFITYQSGTWDSLRIDRSKFPNAVNENDEVSVARNSGFSRLGSFDFILNGRQIIEKIQLGFNASLTFAEGVEELPNRDEIDAFRQVPKWFGKVSFTSIPLKNLYVRMDNTFSSSWYAAKVSSIQSFNEPYNQVNGFFVTDLSFRYRAIGFMNLNLKITNLFDSKYAGVDPYNTADVSLDFMPQHHRMFYFGLSFDFNPKRLLTKIKE